MQLFFHNWYYKPELIQTIEALTAMDNRITSLGDRLSEVIFGETKSFFRTSIQKDAIGSSVSMKVAQLAFLVGYAGIEVNLKALHEPPPPFLKGLVCVLDEETRAGLRLTLPDDAVPSVRPAHADWFVHDVPLMESPLWTWTHTILKTAEANQSNVFAERMSFLRIFLCEMRSHLKSQLDLVNFAQAKIYALVGTAALTLISHYRLEKFAAEFLAEGLFNVTGKW